MNPHADARRTQNNILITRDGQACLGDFTIAGAFVCSYGYHQLETLRHMAPERFSDRGTFLVGGSSRTSDVYSLAMTSFSVRTSFGNPLPLDTSSRYDQVLTGVLPYHGRNVRDMIVDIRAGERPSRATDSSQDQWLQDPIWNVITTGWHSQPNQRCELSVMYHTFSPFSQQEAQNSKPGDLNVRNEGNLTIAETSQTPKQGDSNSGKSSHGSPLSSSFYKTRNQKCRDRLTK